MNSTDKSHDAETNNYDDYIKFISDSKSTLLYFTGPYTIGVDQIKNINIEAKPSKLIEIGKNMTTNMLGLSVK